jgi:hypothetical protein
VRGQLAASAAIITMLVGAGCGGSSEPELSGSQLREQANAACVKLKGQLDGISAQDMRDDLEGSSRKIGQWTTDAIGTIRDLKGSGSAQDQLDRFLAVNDEGTDITQQLAKALRDGDSDKADQLREQLKGTSAKLAQAARDAGLDDCADLNS